MHKHGLYITLPARKHAKVQKENSNVLTKLWLAREVDGFGGRKISIFWWTTHGEQNRDFDNLFFDKN